MRTRARTRWSTARAIGERSGARGRTDAGGLRGSGRCGGDRMGVFGNQSVAGSQPSVHHFRVTPSQCGAIVPVVYGRARIPGILIWTGDFTATKSKGPGKGLGGSGGSFYTY